MRRLLIDAPAAIVDVTVTALLWLDVRVTRAVTLVYWAYWIVAATLGVVCLLAAALTLVAYLLGIPGALGDPIREPPAVVPRSPRASLTAPPRP
jgi:hypothetical protein